MTRVRKGPKRKTGQPAQPPDFGYKELCRVVGEIHLQAQGRAAAAVNQALTLRNWLIGAYLVEYEQNGSDRAKYGDRLIQSLSEDLTRRLGKGFSAREIWKWKRFYQTYPILSTVSIESLQVFLGKLTAALPLPIMTKILPTLSAESQTIGVSLDRLIANLSWSHIMEFIYLDDPLKRAFYEIEAIKNRWSVRQLKRQIETLLFERVGLSKDKDKLMTLAQHGEVLSTPADLFRDPYVLEFTGLAERSSYVESDLETALLDHLQAFLLELGTGFCFEARQKRITVGNEHDFIDLVFYHRILRCHVLVDLKVRKFRPSDAGQMNFYLNYYKNEVMQEGDQPPVGVILCTDKKHTHVEYATAGLSNHVFVSRYLVALPSKEQLEEFLRRDRAGLEKD